MMTVIITIIFATIYERLYVPDTKSLSPLPVLFYLILLLQGIIEQAFTVLSTPEKHSP